MPRTDAKQWNPLQRKRKPHTGVIVNQFGGPGSLPKESSQVNTGFTINKFGGSGSLPKESSHAQPAAPKRADKDKLKRKHRWRPGTVALREIRKYQNSTSTLIPKAAFQRVVREIAQDINPQLRFQATALEALQQAAEEYIADRFRVSYLISMVCQRVTLMPKDIKCLSAITHGRRALSHT